MSGRLQSLEALRGVAALLVVFYHLQDIFVRLAGALPFGGLFSAGDHGVDIFFVLSGFIIARTYAKDIGNPAGLVRYLYGRACRIYPSVWILTGCASVIYLLGFGGQAKAWKLQLWNVAASALLLPQAAPPLVNVTWTLTYEMFFYALFALMLLLRRTGVCLLIAWQVGVCLHAALPVASMGPVLNYYFRPICLEFGLGMLCAWMVAQPWVNQALGRAGSWLLLGTGTATVVASLLYEALWHTHALGGSRVLTYGVGSAFLVAGLTLLEENRRLMTFRPLVSLGEASYSIYLVHFSIITMAAVALVHSGMVPITNLVMLSCAILAIAAGAAFHHLCDRPMQAMLRDIGRRLFKPGRSTPLHDTEPPLAVRGVVRSQ